MNSFKKNIYRTETEDVILPPATPVNFRKTGYTPGINEISLAWDANVDIISGYKIYISDNGGAFTLWHTKSAVTTSSTDPLPLIGHTYTLKMTAYNITTGLESGFSGTVTQVTS